MAKTENKISPIPKTRLVNFGMDEKKIVAVLEEKGVQTGAELLKLNGMEVFPLWQICMKSPRIHEKIVGRRFLRLDSAVKGYARLSPSIRREFLTYSVLGLKNQLAMIHKKAAALQEEISTISRAKFELARESMSSTASLLDDGALIMENACFILAGDITYGMSHNVPRPEISTGEMVRGSDLDIIVVADDGLSSVTVDILDKAIHKRKYFLLKHPNYREEIDYLIKTVSRVREQLLFDSFESMVACKILYEGILLCGSAAIFNTVKELLEKHGIPAKLDRMEMNAVAEREKAEACLMNLPASFPEIEFHHLFYTRDEKEEIY